MKFFTTYYKLSFASKCVSWLGWVFFSGTLIWLTLFVLTGERLTIVRWVSYILPWLAGLLLILVVTAFYFKKRTLAISLLVMTAYISIPYGHLFFPSQIEIVDNQPVYKVMTYSKMGRNHDIDAIARVVMNEKPDILFMQEIGEVEAENLIQQLQDMYNLAQVLLVL